MVQTNAAPASHYDQKMKVQKHYPLKANSILLRIIVIYVKRLLH